MALNFDVSNIKDYPTLTTSPFNENEWHPVTHYLIFAMMGVGINEIKSGNVDEVFRRISLHQKLYGEALAYKSPTDPKEMVRIYITRRDIINHVGLHTNVSTMTASEFNKKILSNFEREAIELCTRPITAYGQVAMVAHRTPKAAEQAA